MGDMAMPPQPPSPPHAPAPEPERRGGLSDAQKWTLGGIGALVVLLAVVLAVLATDVGEDDGTATTTTVPETTTTEAPTTTTEGTTTTTTFGPAIDPYAVAFPSPEGSRRFETPAAVARAYATDVLGFTELVLEAAQPAGESTASVVVQDREDGPDTVIELQRDEDGSWYAVGSTTEDVVVSQPAPGTSLATPFETAGEALAFEGTVEVLVLSQDDPTPLGMGVVTGSGMPPAGPFAGDISFVPPPGPVPGVLVYRITSPEDGRVVAATSIRVRLTNLTA
jgi:hypothetical protein